MIQGAKSYVHCIHCIREERGAQERLEIGIRADALVVACYQHGELGVFTPERIAAMCSGPPAPCDCNNCRAGRAHTVS